MITRRYFAGQEVLAYSLGQVGARVGKSADTIKRWEKQGIIPASFCRSDGNHRLYTTHELNCLEHAIKAFDVKQGNQINIGFKAMVFELFAKVASFYKGQSTSLPKEAL